MKTISMRKARSRSITLAFAALLLGAALMGASCSDDVPSDQTSASSSSSSSSGSSSSTSSSASSGGTGAGGEDGAGGAGGAAPDCVANPMTHVEIINACTDAEAIDKTPDLPLLGANGELPPLP